MKKILIVDNVNIIRLGIKMQFADREDITFREAATVEEALVILEKDDIDIMLLDLELDVSKEFGDENENGLEILRRLKQENLGIPRTIILSGTISEASMVEAFDLGVMDFISKPYKPETLRERVENIIEKRYCKID